MHPIGATHIDFGCVVCFTLLKQHSQASLLSRCIAQHKRDHPSCFDNSSITSIADCAHEAEKCLRVNQSLFQRNHCGDTDGFFDTGEIAVFQCGRCSRCFFKKRGNNQNFNVHYRRTIARYKSTIARLGRSWPVDLLGRVDLTKECSDKRLPISTSLALSNKGCFARVQESK